jgi:hypothetical protein
LSASAPRPFPLLFDDSRWVEMWVWLGVDGCGVEVCVGVGVCGCWCGWVGLSVVWLGGFECGVAGWV